MREESVRLSILLQHGIDQEIQALGPVGLRTRRGQSFDDLAVTEMAGSDLDATLSLAKYDDVENLACGYFTGPARVRLAARVARHAHVVPTDILHALARGAGDPEVRYGALKVAGQAHADPQVGAGWDGDIVSSLSVAMRDEEPAIRLEAAMVAVRVGAARARPLLHALLERESEPSVRTALEELIADLGAAPAEALPTGSSLRLAFPLRTIEGLDQSLAQIETLKLEPTPIEGGEGVRVHVGRALDPQHARLRCMVDNGHGAGCAFFDGDDAAALALEACYGLHTLPRPLARAVVLDGETTADRVGALLGLAMSASTRVLPGESGDHHDLLEWLEGVSKHPDPALRTAAVAARSLVARESP
jgi:hypothetical protein